MNAAAAAIDAMNAVRDAPLREALEMAIKRLESAAKCFRANDLKGLADNVELDIRDVREVLASHPSPPDGGRGKS
jgi:hypothetical protein